MIWLGCAGCDSHRWFGPDNLPIEDVSTPLTPDVAGVWASSAGTPHAPPIPRRQSRWLGKESALEGETFLLQRGTASKNRLKFIVRSRKRLPSSRPYSGSLTLAGFQESESQKQGLRNSLSFWVRILSLFFFFKDELGAGQAAALEVHP